MIATKKAVGRSPSNLPLQHLVDASDGSTQLYLGQQWLQPGDQVFDHTHPCEEILHFLSGKAIVRLGDKLVPVRSGDSVHIPTGLLHGFTNTGNTELHLFVIFPAPEFAPTDIRKMPIP
jgi:mannose-6-phosphate isomerase-like protein (cupin superfamily)